jgi:hypothetical protein
MEVYRRKGWELGRTTRRILFSPAIEPEERDNFTQTLGIEESWGKLYFKDLTYDERDNDFLMGDLRQAFEKGWRIGYLKHPLPNRE